MMRPESDPGVLPWREALLYVALAFFFLVPQSLAPATRIGYVGDSLESVAIVGFVGRQIATDPVHIFDAGFLHPQKNALTLTDHRLLPSIAVAPVLWISGNPVLAYNTALLLAFLLAALGGRALGIELGLGRVAATFAGALFAFHTYAINEAPRLNIVSHGFLAFALCGLVRWLRTGDNSARWRFAVFMLLQGYAANYHLLYGVLLSSLVLIGSAALDARRTLSRLPRLVVPTLVAATLFLPVAIPYLRTFGELELVRSRPRGIDLLHYLSTSPTNRVWGSIGPPARLQQQGPHFIGFLALALAIVGLFTARRSGGSDTSRPRFAAAVAALTAVLVLLSLGDRMVIGGHDLGPGPYGWLFDFVPGFKLVRIPERLGLFVMLGVGLLGGLALDRLVRNGRRTLAIVLGSLAVLEHLSPPVVITEVPRPVRIPAVYKWLAAQPAEPVAEVPVYGEALIRQETIEMFFSTFHHQRLPLGYTAYPTLLSKVVRRALLEFPSEASLAVLAKVGVHRVVVHEGREIGADLRNQIFNFGPENPEQRFRDGVAAARLDVVAGAAAAAASGVLTREAVFGPWMAGAWSGNGERVYRFDSAPAVVAAARPSGVAVSAGRLRPRAKDGDPAPAFDGRLETSYILDRPLHGDEFIEVRFDEPIAVSGVELVLRHESAWPTRFRIAVLNRNGQWMERGEWDGPHMVQLVEGLLKDPRRGTIGFVLDGEPVLGVSLLPQAGGTSAAGLNLPEFRILEKR